MDMGGIAKLHRSGFHSAGIPGFQIDFAHFFSDHIITVAQLVMAGEVHDVVAVLGFDNLASPT